MPPADQKLVVGWAQSQLTRIAQLLYLKYPALQEIQYGFQTNSDVRIKAKIHPPQFIMPDTGEPQLFMVLRMSSARLELYNSANWTVNDWNLAWRCDLSKANMKANLSIEGLFQCLNTCLLTDIDENQTSLNGWTIPNFKVSYPGRFEEINNAFKKWMNDQTANGLTQWGYRFPPPAKKTIKPTPLVVMDVNKMTGLNLPPSMRTPRALFYFEPPLGVTNMDYLDQRYRNVIGMWVRTACDRDTAKVEDIPESIRKWSLNDPDPEKGWDGQYGICRLTTHCDSSALDEEFRTRVRLLVRREPLIDGQDPRIQKSNVVEIGFMPKTVVVNDPQFGLSPIRNVDDNGALSWEASFQGPQPKTGQNMSIIFKGVNKSTAKLDFVYFQIRFLGGFSGKRFTTNTLKDPITASVKATQMLQAKAIQSSVRGTIRVVVQIGLQDQANDTKIRVAPGETIEIQLGALAGTAAQHELQFTESLADSRGQNDIRTNSKWMANIVL